MVNNIDYRLSSEILEIREDIGKFGKYILGFELENHHKEWFKLLISNNDSQSLNKIAGDNIRICSPRNSAKTTWGSIYLAWVIGHNPNIRIILVSYSQEISLAIGMTVKRILESPLYHEVFPEIKPSKYQWANLNWTVERDRIIKDPTLISVGMNGSIASRRADLIFIDDPIKSSIQIANKRIRDAMITWYSEVLEPCLVEGGRIIVMGTRYRLDDLHGTTFNQNNYYQIINQSAILINDNGNEFSYWEKQHPLEKLKQKREKNPRAFASQYQNDPLPESDLTIQEKWIKYIDTIYPSYNSINIGVDLAASFKETSDYSTAVVIGRRDKEYQVLESFKGRLTINQFCDRLIEISQKYLELVPALKIYIEAVGYQVAFSGHFKNKISELELPIRVVPVHPKGDKLQRLLGISPLIEKGSVFFYKGNKNALLIEELLHFGFSSHDDLVDAFVHAQTGFKKSLLEVSDWG
jgi:predicted phage terminase large subunit-like protein